MDVNGLVRLIFLEKSDLTLGVLIGLTLLSVLLMLIRSVMEEKQGGAESDTKSIDAKQLGTAVEGAIKKALADKTVFGGAALGETAGNSEDSSELKKVLNEREAKIAALMSDLEAMKGKVDATTAAGDGAKLSEGDAADLMALRTKVNELQTKLSEYEIIEDDIADLSLFKEENKKLKDEIEKLKAATETAQTQVQAAQVAVEEASAPPSGADLVRTAQAAVTALADAMAVVDETAVVEEPMPASEAPPETTPPAASVEASTSATTGAANEKFELDKTDEVMGEFARALEGVKAPARGSLESHLVVSDPHTQIADPLAAINELLGDDGAEGTESVDSLESAAPKEAAALEENDPFGPLDTEKLIEEVASLDDSKEDSASVLDEALDTDRLMAEMGLSASETPAAAPTAVETALEDTTKSETATAPAAASAPAAAPVAAPTPTLRDTPVDDLLAEFSDPEFQGVKGS